MMFSFIKQKEYNWVGVLPFILAALLWRSDYYRFSLYVAIPIVILYAFFTRWSIIRNSKYWEPYILLFIWMFISCIVSEYSAESLRIMIPTTATFFLSFATYALAKIGSNSKMLFLAFVVLYGSLMYSTFTGDNFTTDFNYANESERRGNTVLNSNQYAYFSLFAIMAVRLILGERKNFRPILRLLIYIVLIVSACYTALMTASRQVLLLEIPLLAYFIYYDYIKGHNRYKGMSLLMIIVLLAVGIPYFVSIYDNSYLAIRAETELDEDARDYLMKRAIDVGVEQPLFGIGLGADESFSHCTYTHLFSRCGIVALLGYFLILYRALKEQWQSYKLTKDDHYLLYLVCILFYIVANFFYSYIDQPFMMTILFIIIGESQKYTITNYGANIV